MKIILSDGSVIDDLTMNGNNYVSQTKVTEDDFKGKLSEIRVIDDNGMEEVYYDLMLIQVQKYADGYYIALAEMTEQEKKDRERDMIMAALLGGVE